MTDDYGTLSIDFLVGFTIFLLAFIWVISMIPGLLIGLQSYTIDYDAVAYRTGVILAEDPGWPVSPAWEAYGDPQKFDVIRFGLALSKDTPNILSQDKVNRFFSVSTTDPSVGFIYPDDYHQRAIFGDFPYSFKISLSDLTNFKVQLVGERLPDDYGYIRRVVKIKEMSYATIDNVYDTNHSYIKAGNGSASSTHVFSLLINNTKLLGEVTDPAYQIDPSREQITINITELKNLTPADVNLANVKIYKLDSGIYSNVPLPASNNPYVNGSTVRLPSSWPATAAKNVDNVTLKFNPQFIDSMKAQNSNIFIVLKFDLKDSVTGLPYSGTFLNNTQALDNLGVMNYDNLDGQKTFGNNPNSTPFDYNYNPDNVTQPKLRDGVLEVAVWSGETGIDNTSTSMGSSSTLFSDNFDAADAPAGWTVTGIADRFSGTPHDGAASIRLRDTPSDISRTISTVGYSGISFSFNMGSKINHAGRYIQAQWSSDGGISWNTVKQINNGDPEDDNDLHPFSYSLPASAGENANFRVRFIINAINPGDKAYVDNVVVGGIAD
jgi:hypothetical protein